MARTRISPQTVPAAGTLEDATFTAADATNDHVFVNDGRTLVLLKNDSGSAKSVTIVSVDDEHGRAGDLTLTAAAGAISIGPRLPKAIWDQKGSEDVHIDLSDDTSLSIAVVSIERPTT